MKHMEVKEHQEGESNLDETEEKLVLFLGVAEEIDGRTKLHKEIFLGKEEFGLDLSFRFVKYHYGPFSFDLNDKLVDLKNKNLILVSEETFVSDDERNLGKKIRYLLSSAGNEMYKRLTTKEKYRDYTSKTKKIVEKWNHRPLKEIKKYVYSKYMS